MKVLCPHQTLPFPAALQGSPTELGAAPLHQIPAPSPSQEGLGSSCHNKTAAGSLRDTQDSSQGPGWCSLGFQLRGKGSAVPRQGIRWSQTELELCLQALRHSQDSEGEGEWFEGCLSSGGKGSSPEGAGAGVEGGGGLLAAPQELLAVGALPSALQG